MLNNKFEIIEEGLLTTKINPRSKEFGVFKEFLDSKVDELDDAQKNEIELHSIRIRMIDYLNTEISRREIVNSGAFLKVILKRLNIQQNRFADFLGIKPSNLSKLLNGERSISVELSLIFEQLFKIESNIWLNIQTKNKLAKLSRREIQSFKKYTLGKLLKKTKKNMG